jgi:uncharacterized protein (TIGR03435 family)
MRSRILFAACLVGSSLLWSQRAVDTSISFPVATIKPSLPETATSIQIRGNRFVTEGTTFLDLFKYAYSIHPDQLVGGPAWLRKDKFDIVADPETDSRPNSDQMKILVQHLLTERFHLVMHREKRRLPVFVLLRMSGEPKLKKSAANPDGFPVVGYSPAGRLEVGNSTMGNFAAFLQRFILDRPTVDETGISGKYDFVLRWKPDNALPDGSENAADDSEALPGVSTAIKEQLGLNLRAAKSEIDVFVVENIEQPIPN